MAIKVTEADKERIWPNGGLRVFLSHKSTNKKTAANLKTELSNFGISCFVAHKDIKPTRPWQRDIERALSSMDILVALMSKSFHDSDWTDQEVGYALGRGIPVIAAKIGKNGQLPYGFIGKDQALSCTTGDLATELVKLLIAHDEVLDAFTFSVQNCGSYDEGNGLAEVLPSIEHLSNAQRRRLIDAYNNNGQVAGSWGFNGNRPTVYGHGLAHHLKRITGKTYREDEQGDLV